MIISPPFLPSPTANGTNTAVTGDTVVPDANVCAAGMLECPPGNGAYPVSYSLGWHGGVHLAAPRDPQGNAERVRAIADGTVVFVRNTDATEHVALSYRGVRTDDGCVVIKHTTEIGEGDNAKVTFFSIYMHLQTVVAPLVGKRVYRKDVLGIAGLIYGQRGQIHFEIVCDKANLQKLAGRTTQPLAAAGRKDAVYGDVWFKVPRGSLIFNHEPHPYRLDDRGPSPCSYSGIRPQDGTSTRSDYVVRMRYERGNCMLTTFGQCSNGTYEEVGSQSARAGYAYDMYNEANRLSEKYNELNHAAGCAYAAVPSPSAIYEILRFGRTMGSDALPPNGRFGHWRQIRTPELTGWINLNLPEIGVYSDADFPHWAGWSLIDGGAGASSLCEAPTIKQWLDLNGDGQVTHAEGVAALNEPHIRDQMSKAICRFPSEWTKLGIEERWGWLKRPHSALPAPLSSDEFDTLKQHIEALAFWEEATANHASLPAWDDCWHLPPRAFVEHFRKCGWLSESELSHLMPRRAWFTQTGLTRVPTAAMLTATEARARVAPHQVQLNKALRKYSISSTPARLALFFAQTIIETDRWKTFREYGRGAVNPAIPMAQYYTAFYGRGIMQLTWAGNYEAYGKFRRVSNNTESYIGEPRVTPTSCHYWADPTVRDGQGQIIGITGVPRLWAPRYNPDILASDPAHASESGAFYWIWKHHSGARDINRIADRGFKAEVIDMINKLVNGGGFGYFERFAYSHYTRNILTDWVPPDVTVTVRTPRNGVSVNVDLSRPE